MLADELDYVVGVDTHRDEHVLGGRCGAGGGGRGRGRRCGRTRAATRRRFASPSARGRQARLGDRGHRQLRRRSCPLPRRRAARRCSRSAARRGPSGGCAAKTTHSTRPATARAALASETLALPRAGERREALRLLLVARRSAVDVRREALAQLRGVIVTAPDRLREELRGLPSGRLLERCSRLRRSSTASADELATRLVLRSLARRIQAATAEADELERELLAHVRALAPRLLDEPGVGPIVAAQLLVAWSHRGRRPLRSRLRTPRRRRPDPRLQRPNHPAPAQPRRRPPTQPRAAHRRPPPPPTRPRDQGLHRPTHRRRQNPPRRHPPAQALPRPPPLPATAKPGAADDLTSHRSIIPAHWPSPPLSSGRNRANRFMAFPEPRLRSGATHDRSLRWYVFELPAVAAFHVVALAVLHPKPLPAVEAQVAAKRFRHRENDSMQEARGFKTTVDSPASGDVPQHWALEGATR